MPEESAKQRLKILYLYKILFEQTDENHYMTMPQIINTLKEDYGITVARKALYQDIEALREFGVDIVLERSNNAGYSIVNRDFEMPELILLADAVTCSRFFTPKKANDLVNKLKQLCSTHEAKMIDRNAFVLGDSTFDNKSIYFNIDAIHRAISDKKKISFRYFDYDLKMRRKYRDGLRVCSPCALTWSDEKYYLIAHYEKYDGVSHFRVDKMEGVEVLEAPAHEFPKDFSLSEYLRSTFSMFSGAIDTVTMRFENSLINAVTDRFGRKISVARDDEEHFIVEVPVRTEHPETFFGWLFQFGTSAQILSPEPLRKSYISTLRAVLKNEAGK